MNETDCLMMTGVIMMVIAMPPAIILAGWGLYLAHLNHRDRHLEEGVRGALHSVEILDERTNGRRD